MPCSRRVTFVYLPAPTSPPTLDLQPCNPNVVPNTGFGGNLQGVDAPTLSPPFADQTWTYYATSTGVAYYWNITDQAWE